MKKINNDIVSLVDSLIEEKRNSHLSKVLYLDIETGLSEDYKDFMPKDFPAPSNYKDEEKIKAAKEAARDKWIEKCSLSPLTGKMLAFGIMVNEQVVIRDINSSANEEILLTEFWHTVNEHIINGGRVAGWNILGFDLPFALVRAWKYKIYSEFSIKDKWNSSFIDLQQWFTSTMSYKDSFISLADAAKFLKIGEKTQDVSKNFEYYYKTDKERALKHLENDVKLCQKIGEIIL